MKKSRKMVPSDYPTMAFRVSQEDKDRLNKLVDEVKSLCNRNQSSSMKTFKKNDIFVDALFLGLLSLKKKVSS